jgi:multicomponent K+:H+ antiporter subunit A
MEYAVIILTPFALMPAVLAVRAWLRAVRTAWLVSAAMFALFVWLLLRIPQVAEQGSLAFSLPWMPQIGLALSLYVDGLALLFALVITGIGTAVFLYAGYYFEGTKQFARFSALLLAFTGSMLALVLAGNLLTLFIAWELTSIVSFLLISFKHGDAAARAGASQALMVTGGGGLALLVGLLLMGSALGSMEFAELLASGDLLSQHPWYAAIAVLVMLGCFSKSAQFPLHFWLPNAMAAPTPASAFLHSATMVKAGIYLLARFYPVLGDTPLWSAALPAFGLATMLLAAAFALLQRDLKGILAFTTISQLGALTALIGLPGAAGIAPATVGIVAHALYKAALFLVAGSVDHVTGTRNIDELSGLRRQMPGFAVVAAVAALSMAGVPPMLGFVAKETLLEAMLEQPLALVAVVLSAGLTATVALRFVWDVFMGPQRGDLPKEEHADHDVHHPYGDDAYDASPYHEIPRGMVVGPGVLALLSLVAGIGVAPLITPLVAAAIGRPASLYLFPPGGLNLALGLSLAALVAGTAFFAVRRAWLRWNVPLTPSGALVYDGVVRAVEALGDLLLRTQAGKIRFYLMMIFIAVIVLLSPVIPSLLPEVAQPPFIIEGAADILKAFLLLLVLGTTLASIIFKQHLLAALSLGIAGYAVGGLFLLEPAPDVALVQFVVETLATVLIIMILARTSEQERERVLQRVWGGTRTGLARDILISVTIGGAVAIFALAAVAARPTPDAIASWYLENAPAVGVNTVVAGILTDFRGTDTLIEISVFGMAALGVLTLLAGAAVPVRKAARGASSRAAAAGDTIPPAPEPKAALEEDAERPERVYLKTHISDPILQLAAGLALPIALLIALAHILYGYEGPGDGFTAGVIAGLGIALLYVVLGYQGTKQRLRWLHPAPLVGAGLATSIAIALLPLLLGDSFFGHLALSGLAPADIKLASSLVFELGIFLTVFGGVSVIMEAISHPRESEPL